MECTFCKSILQTTSSLNYHMKNNKKCLEIQVETVGTANSNLVECEYCNKNFTYIKKHLNICKEKKKENNEKIKNDHEQLKIKYEKKIQEIKNEHKQLKSN